MPRILRPAVLDLIGNTPLMVVPDKMSGDQRPGKLRHGAQSVAGQRPARRLLNRHPGGGCTPLLSRADGAEAGRLVCLRHRDPLPVEDEHFVTRFDLINHLRKKFG